MEKIMKNINIFNALATIRNLAQNNEEIISRLDVVEEGIKEVTETINALATVKVLTELQTGLNVLEEQEKARKSIIDYIIEHDKKVIVPREIWEEWNKIIVGTMSEKTISLHDMLYIAGHSYKNVKIQLRTYSNEIRLSISAIY